MVHAFRICSHQTVRDGGAGGGGGEGGWMGGCDIDLKKVSALLLD